MDGSNRVEITGILLGLRRESAGRADLTNQLFEATYRELRRVAAGLMRRERPEHTLQPTALVNEAYLRLVDGTQVQWEDRAHFFGIAASAMRRILVEHARRRGADKRGGDWERVTLDEQIGAPAVPDVAVLDLDRLLTDLSAMDERMVRIVELRVFGGMQVNEIAHVLGVSERKVYKDWRIAKMWLARELSREGSP
jgi:RNA polymerase sigma factor (TIGR02999 family)